MPPIPIHDENGAVITKEILQEGYGNFIVSGATVRLHYTLWLTNESLGTPEERKIDSSHDRGVPFKFKVGTGVVFEGLDIGVGTMQKGEHSILIIHPNYAFGDLGSALKIPPKEELKVDVEILDWQYEDLSPTNDRSIEKIHVFKKGIGYLSPKEGSVVEVHITGRDGSNVLEDRDLIFCLGRGTEDKVPKGVEHALYKLKLGEKSTVSISRRHISNAPFLRELPVTTLQVEYDIELKRFERLEEKEKTWPLSDDVKIQNCELYKARGNYLVKLERYKQAIIMYFKIQKILAKDDVLLYKNEITKKLLSSAYLNLALCYLKTKNYKGVIASAMKAMTLDPDNDKAYYRCGMANFCLSKYGKAFQDFNECLRINPMNTAASTQLCQIKRITQRRLKEAEKEERKESSDRNT